MNYKEFYKAELFPETDIEITDEYLKQHGWNKYGDILDPNTKWYYFDNGILGRINVNTCGKKPTYTLHINYESQDCRRVITISDIKAAIYSFLCGKRGIKYGYNPDVKGYQYLTLYNDDESNEWRYNQYCKMIKAIE